MTSAKSTPLRKSDATRLFHTPQSIVREPANDDEAERRMRRSETLDASMTSGNTTSAEDNDNIKMCLMLYSDNKLSKENAWSLSIIDSFEQLITRHSKTLQNFQVAGSTLEASTKVYGLRVDSVHTDVMRMCSELTRQSARAMNNNPADQDENDDPGDTVNNEGDPNTSTGQQQPKPKKRGPRKLVSTVTKAKESINSLLDTNPFTDPFFAKLNSVVGDVNSSSRLMQNIVPTKNAELRLRMDYPFWDPSESPELDLAGQPETYEGIESCELSVLPIGPDNGLHALRSGYLITDAPAEDDEDDDDPRGNRTSWDQQMDDMEARELEGTLINRSALEVQFDINAEVEPIPTGDAFILDYDAKDIDGNDDFAEDDDLVLDQCKGLMRKTVLIEDMRPVDTSSAQLEYSYRPLDNISQFWAGPTHWKFKRSLRPRHTSIVTGTDRSSELSDRPKRGRRRKKQYEHASLDDVLSVEDVLFQVYNLNRPVKGITCLKSSICKKWDSKKLKLPTDYNHNRDRFDAWQFAGGLTIREQCGPLGQAPSEEYNCDTGDDQTSCRDDIHDGEDDDMGMDHGVGSFLPLPNDVTPQEMDGQDKLLNQTMPTDAISTEYKGAPDKVNKIHLVYAKTAKVIDMKQLKYNCWRLISAQVLSEQAITPSTQVGSQPDVELPPTQSAEGQLRFSSLYRKVPQLLSKTMSENITKSLAFYAVLHLANEKSLRLVHQDDLKDFTIKKAEL